MSQGRKSAFLAAVAVEVSRAKQWGEKTAQILKGAGCGSQDLSVITNNSLPYTFKLYIFLAEFLCIWLKAPEQNDPERDINSAFLLPIHLIF